VELETSLEDDVEESVEMEEVDEASLEVDDVLLGTELSEEELLLAVVLELVIRLLEEVDDSALDEASVLEELEYEDASVLELTADDDVELGNEELESLFVKELVKVNVELDSLDKS
jgi:hypothetical protein